MSFFESNAKKNRNSKNMFARSNKFSREGNKSERLMEGIGEWTSFYRANPHRFVNDYLGIKLKLFQQILIYAMMHFNFMTYIASRGQQGDFKIW